MSAAAAFPPIGDYAAIGNCRTVGLVSRDGALEWLCLPHYSGPSLFSAILDRSAGHFSIRPREPRRIERRYRDGTNVLETTFECAGGTLRLTDCMPLPPEPDTALRTPHELEPEHEVLRRVECLAGEVELEVEFAPRAGYGRERPRFADCGRLGWQLASCHFGAFLQSGIALRADRERDLLRGEAKLRAGEERWLSFSYDEAEASVLPPLGVHARDRLEATAGWWKWWAGRSRYEGRYREAVIRSALALKLLHCATSGAVLAAPTTSLPEQAGGARNWDYRYCWVRDSALVLHAFLRLRHVDEAEGFLGWLLHATRLTWPRLQVMYDLYGETSLKERVLPQLSGYRDSRPVRVGNAAHEQLQLDIYGELVAAVAQYVDAGGELDASERTMVAGLGRSVCELWRRPDQGIWETRGEARHHTYSKAMCWLALDRLRRLGLGHDAAALGRECDAIRAEIESRGFNASLDAYVGYFDGAEPDASLLLLARHGYCKPDHPRMQGTWRLIRDRLMRDGLLQRYPLEGDYDGLPGGENTFAPCSFWAAEYLANAGRRDEARELFERLLGCANDLGLYAEEIVPGSREPIGNFPQAFTHVSLISAATALSVESTAQR